MGEGRADEERVVENRRMHEKTVWIIFITAMAFLLSRHLWGTPLVRRLMELEIRAHLKMALSMNVWWALIRSSKLWTWNLTSGKHSSKKL